MKRHPALVPLSRDHHHALMVARRLRRTTHKNATEAAQAFLKHWKEEEQAHFRIEEDVLLPAYAAHGDVAHPAVVRALLDHVLICRDARRLGDAPSLGLLHELGARLAAHVELRSASCSR